MLTRRPVGARFSRRPRAGKTELAQLEEYLSRNLFSWMRADYRTEAGGKVTAFLDKVADGVGARAIDPAHAFSQSTGGLQVNAVTTSALINGREVATFTAAQRYVSSIPPANWSIQDGTGWSVLLILVPKEAANVTHSLLSTHTSAATGFNLYYTGATHNPDWGVFSGASDISPAPSGGGLTPDVATFLRARYMEGDTPEILLKSGPATVISGPSSAAPTAGAPQNAITLGALNNGGQAANFLFADLLLYKTASLASIQRYALLRYGMTVS